MGEDYKRSVCAFCPFRPKCDDLRGKHHCPTCPQSLLCLMRKEIALTDCDVARARWRENLPGKCLLAQRLAARFIEKQSVGQRSMSVHGVTLENLDPFLRDGQGKPICPRCSYPTVTSGIAHDWNPEKGRTSVLKLSCRICGLDEVTPLE